jgi:uncharacterized protein
MPYLHGIEVLELTSGWRTITTARASVIGLVGTAPAADATKYPLNTPVLLTAGTLALLGATGTAPPALDLIFAQASPFVVFVRVADGATPADTLINVIGSAASPRTGLHALRNAEALIGVKPKILIAPAFSQAASVRAALEVVATSLRAISFVDGPDTNQAAAIALAALIGTPRVIPCDPWYIAGPANAVASPSAVLAGVQARVDAELGFWFSPSNQVAFGVTGTTRPIEFALSDPNTEANLLNEKGVMTAVRRNGIRVWGGRTCSPDPLWAFLSVRRTADMIYESLEQSYLWALDKPFSAQLLLDIRDSGKAYLDSLKARGAILGGDMWVNPDLNTETTLKAGQLYVDFDFEPPGQLERLTFRAQRNGGYYNELVSAVASTTTNQ